MSDGILIAIISGTFSFVASTITVIITSLTGNKKVTNEIRLDLAKYQTATNEQITELTREVREHNNFARRMPVVENEIKHIEEKISDLHKND